jgi:hypothetical protein
VTATMSAVPYPGAWREEGGAVMALDKGASLTVAPWSSRVFTRRFQSVE